MDELKQVILVRSDLKLPPGKLSVQVAHASVEAVIRSLKSGKSANKKELVDSWRRQGMKKVVLKVKDLEGLHQYNELAKSSGFVTALITDAGLTVLEPGTVTCLAIGPDSDKKIDLITGNLKIL